MPPIKSYTIKSYDGSETLFSSTSVGTALKILPTGISIADGTVWTYEGNKTFVGVSSVPNASRCEFGIGSASFFPDDLIVYIYEQDSPILPRLLSGKWDNSYAQYGILKLNGIKKRMASGTAAMNYYPIYENDIITWEETAQSGATSGYYVYYPTINGQIWRNNIKVGGEDIVVIGDMSSTSVEVEEGFSYTISATYFNNTVGEKNTVWTINSSFPESTASLRTIVKFKSNNSDWQYFYCSSSSNVYLYFGTEASSALTNVYKSTTGWVDEAYRTIEFEQPIWDNELSAWLNTNAVKQTSSRLSVDLTTLSGWASLSAGAHNIQIVAKASGYRDSEKSEAVSATKAAVYTEVTLQRVNSGGQTQAGSYVETGRCRISNADKTKYYIVVIKNDGNHVLYTSSGYFYWDTASAAWKFTEPNNIVSITRDEGSTIDFSSAPFGYEGAFEGWVDNCCVCVSSNSQPENVDYDAIFAAYPKQSMAAYVCIVEGTQITLADRTTKAIEDITYEDNLLVWNFYEGKFDKAKPCWITKPRVAHEYNLCKFSNGSEIGFVGEGGDIGYHRIYNDELKSFTHTGVAETPIGTHTFAEDGTFPELVSQEIVTKPVRYYNIGTDKHINLFANGILTSSRISNKYAIEDMRYAGERLISEQEEKDYIEKKLELS